MKFALKKMMAGVSLLSCLCLITSDAHAVLASVKSTGMAAAVIAYPQDAEAGAFNPAGMVDVGDRFDVGLAIDRTSRKAAIKGNLAPFGVNGKFDANHHAKFAINGDVGINKMIGCNMSVGLIIYNRNYNKTKYKNPLPLFGTSPAGLEYVHETISPTFAIKILEKHNFGVSLNWMIQRFWVQGIQNFDNALFSKYPGHVTNHRYNYSQGVSFTLGYRCQVTNTLSVGVTYQPKTYMHKFKKYRGFLAGKGRLNIPQKIGAGVAWRFIPCATICFDVEYINWKRVKALERPLQTNLIANKLGSHSGSGFGFRDQWYYRVGLDYDVLDWVTVRAGFRHTNTPIRRSQTAVNALTVDTVEDYLTVGATACLNPSNEISFFYAHGFNFKVKGKHSIPASFGGGEANLKEYDDVFAISWGHSF
jgi:long-chain fatty acid transport protein